MPLHTDIVSLYTESTTTCWNADDETMGDIRAGVYVCVHGSLKASDDNKQLLVSSIRPVKNFNEISIHFLQCIEGHSNYKMLYGEVGTSNKGIVQEILDYLKRPECASMDDGVPVTDIAQFLDKTVSEVRRALETMEIEGSVFSTSDDYHYKIF